MGGALTVGDIVVIDRAALGTSLPLMSVRLPGYSGIRRFDILAFELAAAGQRTTFLKRVVGLPHDTLMMQNHVLYVNGLPTAEPYVTQRRPTGEYHAAMNWQRAFLLPASDTSTYNPTRDNWGPLVMPSGRYFMLGDRREESVDSRFFGLVARSEILGRASWIVWPGGGAYPGAERLLQASWWRRFGRIEGH
jgi:signal peptidase I